MKRDIILNIFFHIFSAMFVITTLSIAKSYLENYEFYSTFIFVILSVNLFTLNIPAKISINITKKEEIIEYLQFYEFQALLTVFLILCYCYFFSNFILFADFPFIGLLILLIFESNKKKAISDGNQNFKMSRILKLIINLIIYLLPLLYLLFDLREFYLLTFVVFVVVLVIKLKKLIFPNKKIISKIVKLIFLSLTIILISFYERSTVIENIDGINLAYFLICLDLFSKQNFFLNSVSNLILADKRFDNYSIKFSFKILIFTTYFLVGFFFLFLFMHHFTNYFKLNPFSIYLIWTYTSLITMSAYFHIVELKSNDFVKYGLGVLMILFIMIILNILDIDNRIILIFRAFSYFIFLLSLNKFHKKKISLNVF